MLNLPDQLSSAGSPKWLYRELATGYQQIKMGQTEWSQILILCLMSPGHGPKYSAGQFCIEVVIIESLYIGLMECV